MYRKLTLISDFPDSSERNKVQTLPCSIQYLGTNIYLISHPRKRAGLLREQKYELESKHLLMCGLLVS